MTDAVAKERAVCVCFDGVRVLVMRRHRGGRHYAVLPGGGIEVGDSPRDAACRRKREIS